MLCPTQAPQQRPVLHLAKTARMHPVNAVQRPDTNVSRRMLGGHLAGHGVSLAQTQVTRTLVNGLARHWAQRLQVSHPLPTTQLRPQLGWQKGVRMLEKIATRPSAAKDRVCNVSKRLMGGPAAKLTAWPVLIPLMATITIGIAAALACGRLARQIFMPRQHHGCQRSAVRLVKTACTLDVARMLVCNASRSMTLGPCAWTIAQRDPCLLMQTRAFGAARLSVAERQECHKCNPRMCILLRGSKQSVLRLVRIAARVCVAPKPHSSAFARAKVGQLAGLGATLDTHNQMINPVESGTALRLAFAHHVHGGTRPCIVSQ